jgi:ATP-dependent Clp protease, protease subunit
MIYLSDEEKNDDKQKPQDNMMEKFLETRSILLTGEVNKELAERIVKQLLMLEAAGDDPIKVFIDSPGGDADTGYAIFDMIRFVKPDVYTVGMGLVASAGALILLAAEKDKRIAMPNSHYLIHQPASGIRGVATEIEIHAKEIDKMKKRINKLIAEETGKPIKEIEKDTDRDFWMDAEEAKTYGLVSKVVSKRSELKV